MEGNNRNSSPPADAPSFHSFLSTEHLLKLNQIRGRQIDKMRVQVADLGPRFGPFLPLRNQVILEVSVGMDRLVFFLQDGSLTEVRYDGEWRTSLAIIPNPASEQYVTIHNVAVPGPASETVQIVFNNFVDARAFQRSLNQNLEARFPRGDSDSSGTGRM